MGQREAAEALGVEEGTPLLSLTRRSYKQENRSEKLLDFMRVLYHPERFQYRMDHAALVGTDNYDFLLNGVANLIGSQASAQLGPHYHADTDTLDKVDPQVMKHNAVVLAALVYGFATEDLNLPRQTADEVRAVVEATNLAPAMKMFGVYDDWVNGVRAWD